MKKQKDKKRCPNCTGEFIPRRDNQSYCCSSCRIELNNAKNNTKRKELAKIGRPLAKNYEILKGILKGKKEAKVHQEYLRGAGFNFKVMTHVHQMDAKKNIIAGCHDFYYYKIDNEYFKIKRNG